MSEVMATSIQAVRGMNDVLPTHSGLWRKVETIFSECLRDYQYQEIRLPLLEYTALFQRSIGDVTDIVEKEMYTFLDRNSESITLRPEGTAGCVRACMEHGLFHQLPQKLWYNGPMFRYEKPQKGRYRQFHQMGVEVFGIAHVAIELELLALTWRLWERLGLRQKESNCLQLQINTLGTLSERHHYRQLLVDYLQEHFDDLDEESRRRLHRNPLRIMDSKHPGVQAVLLGAPKLQDVLGDESRQKFADLCLGLRQIGIPFSVNPFLVRGLDYYAHTVFEWVTEHLGSQATICAGGRYDNLVAQMGGTAVPAVGFAIGSERLLLLMDQFSTPDLSKNTPFIYILASGEGTQLAALTLAEVLRSQFPGQGVELHTQGGSFKSQFKKANKSGARFAVIIGEQELQDNRISLKDLRSESAQITLDQTALMTYLQAKET